MITIDENIDMVGMFARQKIRINPSSRDKEVILPETQIVMVGDEPFYLSSQGYIIPVSQLHEISMEDSDGNVTPALLFNVGLKLNRDYMEETK